MRIEEYKSLSAEIDDSIKKQETTSNLVITILGISALSAIPNENNISFFLSNNIYFLVAVMFIASVLLSRIIHYRNTVYYLITYLEMQENEVLDDNGNLVNFVWQRDIEKFKSFQFGNGASLSNKLLSMITLGIPFFLRNAGYLVLSGLIYIRTNNLLKTTNQEIVNTQIVSVILMVVFALNIFLTFFVFFDRFILRNRYQRIWRCVLSRENNVEKADKSIFLEMNRKKDLLYLLIILIFEMILILLFPWLNSILLKLFYI